ncbi:P2Y purinoceptor 13-like [Stegastes partitus]|uniref:P2Y purinoceptor 13-like n=1 Tax=Stegastes partitus TaxID=144197 RepID=A0A9Y4K524_9TELE|nr:PREDICTED: P2Y purinoceptor 13-like [Stegastes partitus]
MSSNASTLSTECAASSLVITNEVVSSLYFLLFPAAFLLNGVAVWVSFHLRSTSTFIVYLKNLVAADLLMTLTLPPIAVSLLPGATITLRALACRYTEVIFYSCLYTSIALMGLISLDRFFKIVRPFGKVLGQNVVFSIVMSSLVWVVMFGGTAIPTMVLTDQDPHSDNLTADFCMSLKSPAGISLHKYVVVFMEILFWFVSVLIGFCYICITAKVLKSFRNSGSNNTEGQKKTKLRVFLILLVFCVCFVPLHLVRISVSHIKIFDNAGCSQTWVVAVSKVARWVSATNACLDPLLYIYLCREYRDKLVGMMKAKGICAGLYSDQNEEM